MFSNQESASHSPPPLSATLGSDTFHLRDDEIQAIQGNTDGRHPTPAVQAASGTGETVIGPLIAAGMAAPEHLAVVTIATETDVFFAFTTCFSHACSIYIRNVNQFMPHVLCPRSTNPIFDAKGEGIWSGVE
ncbi:hypothetical protein RB195_021827 [Necator americanus]|uniref:Uncharacterized protein n=1 Tax=Necator americanus TaxID=51031 RepID=A0ABR1ECX4_NECAM